MKKFYLLIILMFLNSSLFGQNISDTIVLTKVHGAKFMQRGKNLTPGNLLQITKLNPEAYKVMHLAKSNDDIAKIFGYAGGFMIGWPIGSLIGGREPNWTMAILGAGMIVFSIPFIDRYNRNARKAVEIYNDGLKQTARNNIEFRFGLTYNGFGISMNF
jgi:hypothetical protein